MSKFVKRFVFCLCGFLSTLFVWGQAGSAHFETEDNWGFKTEGSGYQQAHFPIPNLTLHEIATDPNNPSRFVVAGSRFDGAGRESAIVVLYHQTDDGLAEQARWEANETIGNTSVFTSVAWSKSGHVVACGKQLWGVEVSEFMNPIIPTTNRRARHPSGPPPPPGERGTLNKTIKDIPPREEKPWRMRSFWIHLTPHFDGALHLEDLHMCEESYPHQHATVIRTDNVEESTFWLGTKKWQNGGGHIRKLHLKNSKLVAEPAFKSLWQLEDLYVDENLVVVGNGKNSFNFVKGEKIFNEGKAWIWLMNKSGKPEERLIRRLPLRHKENDFLVRNYQLTSVVGDGKDNFYVTGRERRGMTGTQENPSIAEDFLLVKFHQPEPGKLWRRWMLAAGTPEGREWGTQVEVLNNGDLLVAGNFEGSMVMKGRDLAKGSKEQNLPRLLGSSGQGALNASTDDYEGFVARLKPNGSLLWAQTSGYFGNDFTKLLTVHADEDGNETAYLVGESKQSIGMNPHLIKLSLEGKNDSPFAEQGEGTPSVFWEPPESLRFAEPMTAEFFTASASASFAGEFSYRLNEELVAFDDGKMPFFNPEEKELSVEATFEFKDRDGNIRLVTEVREIEARPGRLYLEVEQVEEARHPETDLPTFRLIPALSGAHANHDPASLAEDVFFTLADGQGGGRLEGDLFIPTAQTRYEIIATFPSSAHYEETTRTVIVEVGDGQKDLSKREEFALRIIDIAGTRDPIFVPKATSVPISATLSFGAQRAFERWVEFLDGQLRTARVKNPWSPKTSVIVEEAMTLMARYNFSFVGSAVNGYLEGSLVFLDLNFNGLLDEDEPFALADESGRYHLSISEDESIAIDLNFNGVIDPGEATLVIMGGTDRASGLDLEIAYKAPPGYAVVTAITTLVAELVEEGLSLPDAEERVKSVLGLPQSINLATFEPLLATSDDQANGLLFVNQATKLANLLNEGSRYLEVASGESISRLEAHYLLLDQLTASIRKDDSSIDLTSRLTLAGFLSSTQNVIADKENTDTNTQSNRATLLSLAEEHSEITMDSAPYLNYILDTIVAVNSALNDKASEATSPYRFKGEAANLQVIFAEAGANASNFLTDEELASLASILDSDASDTSNQEDILRLFENAQSIELNGVSTLVSMAEAEELPNAFAPHFLTTSLSAADALTDDLIIGEILAIDPEEGQVSFSIVEGNPDFDDDGISVFELDPLSGILMVADFNDLELLDEDSLTPKIRAEDEDGLHSEIELPINLREWSFLAGRPRDAIVRTLSAENVSAVGATLVGELTHEGGESPWRKGFEISHNLHFDNPMEVISYTEGTKFTFDLWSLYWDQTYYYRTFIENSSGRSHGNKKRFRTLDNTLEGLFKDAQPLLGADGNQIGDWWDFWFGYAFVTDSGWYFHWDVGWIYPVEQDDGEVWVYFPQLGWMWISREYYPYYYDYSEARWLYLIYADDEVARFYHYEKQSLFTIEK